MAIVQMHRGVHLGGQHLDESEADTSALGLTREFVLGPVKELEDALHLITGDPGAIVTYEKDRLLRLCGVPAESDVHALDLGAGGKFQGIVDKINKNLHEGVLIDEHRGRRKVLYLSCGGKSQGETGRIGLR